MRCKKYQLERKYKMNKSQLIEVVVQKTNMKKKDVEACITAFVDATAAAMISGEKVQISGLGTFSVKEKAARTGRNPKTQEMIEIPASKTTVFTTSKSLKAELTK